ncbi:MAG: iron ABC transporter permease [Oscillospiraceae bacterium]|nr:iron ABC transporter permease [Oscillospiraceae bacterium]
MKKKAVFVNILLICFAILSIILAVGIGPVSVSPVVTAKVLFSKLPILGNLIAQTWDAVSENIIMNLRLPRVLLGFVVGASLSVCGVAMQAMTRNNLADPFVLGVSSGAASFATLGMLFGAFSFLGIYSLSVSAFLGAAVTTVLVYVLSRVRGRINVTQLLLSGVAVSMIMDGITSIIKLSAPNALGLHSAEFWMSGSLAGAKWAYLGLPALVLVLCMAFLMLNHRGLNILLLGDESAVSLGVNVAGLQKGLVLVASLMAGATVAVSGTIGFVGLMVPHFTRLLVGSDHRRVLPVSALLGGVLVVWVDVAARLLIAPEELPVGVLTALIGGPVFIVLLRKSNREKR